MGQDVRCQKITLTFHGLCNALRDDFFHFTQVKQESDSHRNGSHPNADEHHAGDHDDARGYRHG